MKIYEFQAKEIFAENGIPVPSGKAITNADEAFCAAQDMGCPVAVKSQIQAGGRGKAGGIKFADTPEQVKELTRLFLGNALKGEVVKTVLIEKKQQVKTEYYLGITMDRSEKKPVIMFSAAGGMDIEDIAKVFPEKIVKIHVDPVLGLQNFHLGPIAKAVSFEKDLVKQLRTLVARLYDIYVKHDCLTVEINPLALLEDNVFVALDGKLEMDDNSRYRQEKLLNYWDEDNDDPIELIGKKAGFVVIKLDGEVSVISNGAGTAIATLDLLSSQGAAVANILDLSGGATSQKVVKAVNVVTQDKDVKAILFNIFGGITRCDEIAKGVAAAVKELKGNKIPIICRLNGTNRDEGIKILRDAGIDSDTALNTAVDKVVKLLKA
jgi:succinyl-CoA synthetase beta subunit